MKYNPTITISLDPQTGQIKVSAPQDKILAYGMLEMAKEVISKQTKNPESLVKPVHLVPVNGGKVS